MATKDKTRAPKSGWQRETGKKTEALAGHKPRKYAAAEAAAGAELPERKARPRATFQAPRIVRPAKKRVPEVGRLQALVAKTVKALFMTASPEGDLAFVADVRPEVFHDLRLEVGLSGKHIVITFYTRDASLRRLLEGYARELRAALEDKRLRVKAIKVLAAPDPDAPPPVLISSGD